MSKKKHKKPNPNKVPVSQADIKRAKVKARDEAIELVWSIFFTVLQDKEGYDLDGLKRVWNHCENLADSIANGYCTVADLRTILKEESGAYLK